MQKFNEQPRPRVLLEDIDDALAIKLDGLAPTRRRITYRDQVHEEEYDVLITAAGSVRRGAHLHTVAFGAESYGSIQVPEGAGTSSSVGVYVRRIPDSTKATELIIPPGVTDELGELVRTHLIPLFSAMESKSALGIDGHGSHHSFGVARREKLRHWCTPFLQSGDGHVLAASFKRRDGALCWALPPDCPVPDLWVALALKNFREYDPVRVPALPKWWEQPTWATAVQRAARRRVTELIEERDRVLKEFDASLIAAREAVNLADREASGGMARLLTADGELLVEAVTQALEKIGFEVRNMDEIFPEGQKREDLRLRDAEHPGWEAIVEVKGYKRGAAVNDLARLSRWAMRYMGEKGRPPSAMWHIVNAFRETDPTVRPKPIPDDSELRDLADDNGLLIDTRQLFVMQRDLEQGATAAHVLRASLRDNSGRFAGEGVT